MEMEFSDKDLDDVATTEHEHRYIETLDSKDNGKRIFKCKECGKVRTLVQPERRRTE